MVHMLKHGTLLIYDTEWTSWEGFLESNFKQPGRYTEIIQIGAVKLDIANGFRETDSFLCYVQPTINPELSDYIIDLTGITQAIVDDQGMPFSNALDQFVQFIGTDVTALMSYGRDGTVVRRNCKINELDTPVVFDEEQDLRQLLLDLAIIDQPHYSSALPSHFGLPDDQRSHDALGDARSVANVLRHLRKNGQF